MKIGIHELALKTGDYTAEQTLAHVVDLAKQAENWGYHRFWLAEHHGQQTYTSSAPEIIASYIAGQTQSIRIGSGGIMMMHYAPLKVAEVVNTINTLAPNRMDFGVGRAPGSDMETAQVLGRGRVIDPNTIYDEIEASLAYIQGETPDHPLCKLSQASPRPAELAQVYLLGSTGNSAHEAARQGIGYAFAQFFIKGAMDPSIFQAYRSTFVPSAFASEPNIIVSYNVTVGETVEEAEYQAKPYDIYKIMLDAGKPSALLSPEEAANLEISPQVQATIEANRQTHLVGTPSQVAEKLLADKEAYGFDEIMLANFSYDHDHRLYTYQALAEHLLP